MGTLQAVPRIASRTLRALLECTQDARLTVSPTVSLPRFARNQVHLVYDCRPVATSRETRADDWAKLHSSNRYLLSVLAPFGPPGYVLWNLRKPLLMIAALILFNCTYETVHLIFPGSIFEFAAPETWDVFRLGSFVR